MERFWSKCTLGAKIHHFLDTLDQSQLLEHAEDVDDAWYRQKGLDNLRMFEELVYDHTSQAEEFRKSLSQSQLTSWKLIDEWKCGAIQPDQLLGGPLRAIESEEFLPTEWLMNHAAWVATNTSPDESHYQHFLFDLYHTEFVPSSVHWDEQADDEVLALIENTRRRAIRYAACQRTAHKMYAFKISAGVQSEDAAITHPSSIMQEVCPWLPNPETFASTDMPHYLWDATAEKTIVVGELDQIPSYCCISHTWGRWRAKKAATLAGLPWWSIPCNSLFDVTQLPKILTLCADRFKTRYIWFDLVCIPQFDEDQAATTSAELVKLAKTEISRQALIFRKAKYTGIWFNYVDGWNAETATLDYLNLTFLNLTTPSTHYDSGRMRQVAFKDAEYPLQLNIHPFHDKFLGPSTFKSSGSNSTVVSLSSTLSQVQPEHWDRPSAWFSSLWTLQEAYLRPDMILMNRGLEPLCDSAGNWYTLEMIAILVETLQGSMQTGISSGHNMSRKPMRRELPMGPAQLFNLFFNTQLIQRSHSSRAHILVQGNNRQCTGRRAEAIMSAVGLTDWFSAGSSHDELVLEMYPLTFINEAWRKIGPDFFLVEKSIGTPWSSRSYFFGSDRGSMLPFERLDPARLRGERDVKMYPYQAYDSRFHPSVASWSLDRCGSFAVEHAAILASSDKDIQGVPSVEVLLSYQSTAGKTIHKSAVCMTQWINEQPKQYLTFAVNISRDLGLILQGFRLPHSQPLKLIKVGCFEILGLMDNAEVNFPNDDWITSQPVDWVPSVNVNWTIL